MRSRNSIGICGNALILTVFAAAIAIVTASTARAQQVVAFVNGEPVTTLDIAHRAKFLQMSTKKVPTPKEVMDSLIDEILEVHEAKRFGLDVSEDEVDKAYAGVATRMGIDTQKLTQALVGGGASADTLKRRLRKEK
jgi:peptidyl-prolyl cis-trans isomerase SurA